jgi:hypothetical protein
MVQFRPPKPAGQMMLQETKPRPPGSVDAVPSGHTVQSPVALSRKLPASQGPHVAVRGSKAKFSVVQTEQKEASTAPRSPPVHVPLGHGVALLAVPSQ